MEILDELIGEIDGGVRFTGAGIAPIEVPIDPREICTLTIGEPDWAAFAVDELLNDAEVVVIDPEGGFVHVSPYDLRYPRRPVWGQLRRILIDAGVRVPRVRWRCKSKEK